MSDPSPNRLSAMPGLLDEGLLAGQHEATSVLRPERHARPVRCEDLAGAMAEIERACQVWGGGGHPLLPVHDGAVPAPYLRLLASEQVDFVGGLQDIVDVDLPRRVDVRPPWDHPAVLVAVSEPREKWRPVQVVRLDPQDPWRPIYAAVLGSWPSAPDPALLDFAGLREDLRFEEIVPVESVDVTGSLMDLIERALDRERLSPRSLSTMFLAHGLQPDTSFLGDVDQVLPSSWTTRRAAGPNIIVAVSPGSVEDVAMLWNLRGAHGGGRAMPIGVPANQIDAKVLRDLQEPGRATMFGLGGGAVFLTSASVRLEDLAELATQSAMAKAVPYESLLTFGPAPGRPRGHVSSWDDGTARLDPMSDADRVVLRESRSALRGPRLLLDVTVDGYPLPADPTMRGTDLFGRFQGGAAQVAVTGAAASADRAGAVAFVLDMPGSRGAEPGAGRGGLGARAGSSDADPVPGQRAHDRHAAASSAPRTALPYGRA